MPDEFRPDFCPYIFGFLSVSNLISDIARDNVFMEISWPE